MTRVLVLNGPNLGRLGSREPDVYGGQDLSALRVLLAEEAGEQVEIDLRQTDDEAELIGWLHEAVDTADAGDPQPGGVHALQLRAAGCRGAGHEGGAPAGRGAHHEPARAGGVPPHERHLGGGDGRDRRVRVRLVPAGADRGAPVGVGRARRGRYTRTGATALIFSERNQRSIMATTNDIKNGIVLNIDGQLWNVIDFQHVKPGKGGAFVRTKMKNVMSGKVVDRTFNAGTKIEFATVDRRDFQYLYRDGESFVFMDTTDYDQITVPATIGRRRRQLHAREPERARSRSTTASRSTSSCRRRSILEVTYTEPGLQGDRSSAGTKPATVETGYEIQVPLFLETGHQGQGRHPRRATTSAASTRRS